MRRCTSTDHVEQVCMHSFKMIGEKLKELCPQGIFYDSNLTWKKLSQKSGKIDKKNTHTKKKNNNNKKKNNKKKQQTNKTKKKKKKNKTKKNKKKKREDNSQTTCTSSDIVKNTCKVSKRSLKNCKSSWVHKLPISLCLRAKTRTDERPNPF